MDFTKIKLNLHLFDGEGGEGAAEGAATEAAETTETAQPSPEEAAKARREAFETRIKGEDKDLFDERVQSILKDRFKDTKKQAAALEKSQAVLALVAKRYPTVDASDTDALMAAVEQDESVWERYAEENGLTTEQAKRFAKMEQENAQFKQRYEEQRRQTEAQAIYSKWQSEAQACQQKYGKFDLQQETQNPDTGERFVNMLRSGVDVTTAYEVTHMQELMSGALRTAVQTTQKKVTDDIKARGKRPDENGLNAGGAAATTLDVNNLNDAQLKELSERARRGEKITFRASP